MCICVTNIRRRSYTCSVQVSSTRMINIHYVDGLDVASAKFLFFRLFTLKVVYVVMMKETKKRRLYQFGLASSLGEDVENFVF